MHVFLIYPLWNCCVNSVLHTVKCICREGILATLAPVHRSWRHNTQNKKAHMVRWLQAAEGRKGSMDRWMERQTWWFYGGPEWSRPCGVVGIAVMLIDAWLFASAFTVNTKKHKKEKRQKWEQMRKPSVNSQKMQSHNRYCWEGATDSRDLITIYTFRKIYRGRPNQKTQQHTNHHVCSFYLNVIWPTKHLYAMQTNTAPSSFCTGSLPNHHKVSIILYFSCQQIPWPQPKIC